MAERLGTNEEWLARYVDLSVEDAVALAGSEGHPVRVLKPGGYASADWWPDRLNIQLDSQGNIVRIYAG